METLVARPSQVKNIIRRAAKVRRPLFIWGPPGIGKSDLVRSVGRSGVLGNTLVIDMRLALMEPTDLRGMPYRDPVSNTMCWAPPVDLPSQELASQYDAVILFMDELNSAPPQVQAAAYQLVLDGRVGNYILPKNVVILAAGNRENDRGVTYRMPAPLANRFRHVHLNVNHEDWNVWAIQNNIHPDVIGYLAHAKADLFNHNPKTSGTVFASPRSWLFVSEMLWEEDFNQADSFEQKVEVAGAVGEGIAVKFIEHRRVRQYMPNPDQIIAGEVLNLTSEVSNEISAKYSLAVGICYELNICYQERKAEFRKALNHALRFAFNNFQPEAVIVMIKTLLSEYKMKFNIRTDLDPDLHKIFSEKYTKYIV